jgi:iron complex transport system permease protein
VSVAAAATDAQAPGARARRLPVAVALPLALALLAAFGIASIVIGAYRIDVTDVARLLLAPAGFTEAGDSARHAAVFYGIRLPRVLLAVVVGGALGAAGAALQALFRNPLADPGLIGVSSGAVLAVAIVIVLGGALLPGFVRATGYWSLPIAAFVGATIATAAVYAIARTPSGTSVGLMLLAGIAVMVLAEAITAYLSYLSNDEQLRQLTLWRLGTLGGATWPIVLVTSGLVAGGGAVLLAQSRALNLLALGEAEARHLGVRIERLKAITVIAAALVVGAGVAASGALFFIGLMAPHLVRLACGPDQRIVMPGAMLVGAVLVLGGDLLARTVVVPSELPLGVPVALAGVPVFLGLLLRARRSGWS